jgi:hypothetical protein
MKGVPPQLLEFLRRYDPEIRSLALHLRTVIHEEMAPCHEYIFAMRSKIVLLYGATERVIDDGICHINVFVRQVNLGFSRGTELEDPAGVLQGTGKAMRHITLKASIDLRRPEIRSFLRKARRHAGLARRHRYAAKVVTKVKTSKPAKRLSLPSDISSNIGKDIINDDSLLPNRRLQPSAAEAIMSRRG